MELFLSLPSLKKVIPIASDSVSRSWFGVLNHPEQHGYTGTPEEICEQIADEWTAGSSTRTCACAYCISAAQLPHIHLVLEDNVAMRFSAIKKAFAKSGMHIEATKGTKKQAEDYIQKRPPFDEKGETVLYIARRGDIKGASGKRSDLEQIKELLDAGYTPAEIFKTSISFRRYDRIIKDAFFAKRCSETPPKRQVTVHWLVGDSGSGKTYRFIQLCEEYGEDQVYHVSDFRSGAFDFYCAQPILFIDELKPYNLSYTFLLQLLDQYKVQIHARYTNSYMLWNEVYITSIFAPEQFYAHIESIMNRQIDTYEQLRRRITDITYCYIDEQSQFQRFTMPMSEYKNFDDLRVQAMMPPFPFDNEVKG